ACLMLLSFVCGMANPSVNPVVLSASRLVKPFTTLFLFFAIPCSTASDAISSKTASFVLSVVLYLINFLSNSSIIQHLPYFFHCTVSCIFQTRNHQQETRLK